MLESFLGLWRGERPREVIWSGDLTYWMAGQEQMGLGRPNWKTDEEFIKLHLELGVMPYFCWDCSVKTQEEFSVEVRREARNEGARRVSYLHTPWGTLTSATEFSTISVSQAPVKHFVEGEGDLEVLLRTLEHRKLRAEGPERLVKRMEKWAGLGGYPLVVLPRSPLSSFAYEWSNLENAIFMIADHEEKVRQLFGLLEEQERPVMDVVCGAGLPLVHFPDNLSSETLTGLYDRWMKAGHQRRLARLHGAGTKVVVHLDGTVRGLLPKLAAAGFDGVEALTPTPVGDISAAEMAAVVGNEECVLWGGIPGAMFAPPFEWEEVETHVREVLKAWRGRRFILGTADQVPPNGNIEFCRRIGEMVRSEV